MTFSQYVGMESELSVHIGIPTTVLPALLDLKWQSQRSGRR